MEAGFSTTGTPIPSTATSAEGGEISAGAQVEGGFPFVGKAQGNLGGKAVYSSSNTQDVRPDFLALLVRELKGKNFVVFIDDFHYIDREIQADVATVIKDATSKGLRFILAAVPYHADDVVLANSDLRGRMLALDFDYWGEDELAKIAEKGFQALNVLIPTAVIRKFAKEAAGSPQLMQSLCLNTCFEVDVEVTAPAAWTPEIGDTTFRKICCRTAQTNDYSSVIRGMQEGPKVRGTERNAYTLKDGSASDVYPIVVRAIAADSPELTQSYPKLLARIAGVCFKDHPQGSSVTGACSHMASLANNIAGSAILEWDAGKDVLDIRDPYLLFALRWGESI